MRVRTRAVVAAGVLSFAVACGDSEPGQARPDSGPPADASSPPPEIEELTVSWLHELGPMGDGCLAFGPDGNLTVATAVAEEGGSRPLLVQFAVDGSELWRQLDDRLEPPPAPFGPPTGGFDIAIGASGRIAAVGGLHAIADGHPIADILVRQHRPNGTTLWNRYHDVEPAGGETDWDRGEGIAVDAAGDLVAVGFEGSRCGEQGLRLCTSSWLARYRADGELVWTRGGDPRQHIVAVAAAGDGSFFTVVEDTDQDGNLERAGVEKRDSGGNRTWIRWQPSSDHVEWLAVDGAGGPIVGANRFDGASDRFLRRFTPDGELDWQGDLGLPAGLEAPDGVYVGQRPSAGPVAIGPDGSIYTAATASVMYDRDSDFPSTSNRLLLFKFTSDGERVSARMIHRDLDRPVIDLAVGPDGTVAFAVEFTAPGDARAWAVGAVAPD